MTPATAEAAERRFRAQAVDAVRSRGRAIQAAAPPAEKEEGFRGNLRSGASGAGLVNGAASLGNALIRRPGEVVASQAAPA